MLKIEFYRNLLVIATTAALWSAPALLRATELHPLIITGIGIDKEATVHPVPVYPRAPLALGIDGKVQVEVTVQNGRITEVNLLSGSPLLAYSAKEWIVSNWRLVASSRSRSIISGTCDLLVAAGLSKEAAPR